MWAGLRLSVCMFSIYRESHDDEASHAFHNADLTSCCILFLCGEDVKRKSLCRAYGKA